MVVRLSSALGLATAVLLLGPVLASTASAQDAMQLDWEFKNSLQRGPTSESGAARHEQRQDVGGAREHIKAARRQPRRYRHRT
jgi:hypothetical protein